MKLPPASELEQLESVRAQCGSSHLCDSSGTGLQPLPASTPLVMSYINLQYIEGKNDSQVLLTAMQSGSRFCKVSFTFEVATSLTEKLRAFALPQQPLNCIRLCSSRRSGFAGRNPDRFAKRAKLSASLSSLPA